MESIKCKKCRNVTSAANSFCPKCGTPLPFVQNVSSKSKTDRSKTTRKELGIVIGLIAFIIAIPLFINSIPNTPNKITNQNQSQSKISESDYRSACQQFDYKDLCRYPEDYAGELVKVEVRISQILKDGETYWQGYTGNDGHGYYDNEYVLVDNRGRGAVRVIEEDIVVVYGEYVGLITMERALGSIEVELPCISVEYIDIIN